MTVAPTLAPSTATPAATGGAPPGADTVSAPTGTGSRSAGARHPATSPRSSVAEPAPEPTSPPPSAAPARRRGAARRPTVTSAFGAGRREGHDASAFYERFSPPVLSEDREVAGPVDLAERCIHGDARDMHHLPDASVALIVTSPPYFVGKEYEDEVLRAAREGRALGEVPGTYRDYLHLLHEVFAECVRVLEPGGRIAVNVANLGRKPYRSLAADVIGILEDLGLLLRGEIIWQKGRSSSGSCAWGSFRSPANPVLRDVTERIVVASKGRFDRALAAGERRRRGLPHQATLTNDEFVDATRDVWEIDPESARRVGHPAPFPVELPLRLIDLYTYVGDLVCDPFMGSGSTLVAARRAGRAWVGYDTDAHYVELARRRVAATRPRPGLDPDEMAGFGIPADPPAGEGEAGASPVVEADLVSDTFVMAAVERGRKAGDLAAAALAAAGFEPTDEPVRLPRLGLQVDARVRGRDGSPWLVLVAGGFTTVRPGLQRGDAVWRVIAQAHLVVAGRRRGELDDRTRLLVLTSSRPRPGSELDRALRAIGPDVVTDVIEILEPGDLERLAVLATGRAPVVGYWNDDELDAP